MKLILLSGGVESTALLTRSTPEDIALVIEPTFSNDLPTYRRVSVELMAKRYGVSLVSAKADLPDLGSRKFVHQMSTFISLASLLVARNPRIDAVWCGRNKAEPADNIKGYIEDCMKAWAILHPLVPFQHPLDHLTKAEQYALIPKEVKPLVSSCIHHRFCGLCYKCKEWLWLSESSL